MKKVDDMNWDLNHEGNIKTNHANFKNVKELLDSKGPGFCLAKWNQVTMHLGTGVTHSCHHPAVHKIPLEELKDNPSALHNTKFKKEQRKTMLNGGRPKECDYCWRIEDNNTGEFSDRVFKSLEPWALKHNDIIKDMDGDENVLPTYIEVSFSNVCNMKCTYCGPEASSKWYEDIKQNGPIKLLEGTDDEYWAQGWQQDLEVFKNREYNPYVEAFWEWWPELSKNLKVFRITGGEPLMSKDTFKVLEDLIENPRPDLEISINTNLSVPDKLWNRFIDLAIQLKDSDNIKNLTVYTSVEGWGKRAEYARTGLNFELFLQRYEQLISMGNIRAVLMSTYNMFSITSFTRLLEWQYDLRLKYNKNPVVLNYAETGFRSPGHRLPETDINWKQELATVCIDVPYLRHPTFLDCRNSTHQLAEEYMLVSLDYMASRTTYPGWTVHKGFEQNEIDKFKRIVFHRLYFNKKNSDGTPDYHNRRDLDLNRSQFYEFIQKIDQRNNTDFLSTFPEMEQFYNECGEARDRILNGR